MNVGTKSLLFGVHQFAFHPVAVWRAWRFLYGQRPTWRECVCIVVHDWGYWGKPNMDGPEGMRHPAGGAFIASFLLDDPKLPLSLYWHGFTACHSRHYAEKVMECGPSKLCWADKAATLFYPDWLYLLLARTSGEIVEYRANADGSGFVGAEFPDIVWLHKLKKYESDRAIERAKAFRT